MFDNASINGLLGVLTGVSTITMWSSLVVTMTLPLPPVHEEENKPTEEDTNEGEVEASLVAKVYVHVSSERNSNQYGEGSGPLDKTPSSGEVLGPNSLKSVHLGITVLLNKT